MTLNDWKNLPITQEIMAEFKRRQVEAKDQLAVSAGVDPRADAWKSGAIAAYEDVLNIELDDEESHN